MSKLLKALLATAMTFSLVTVTKAEGAEKVSLTVASDEVTVSAKVMSDYSIVATVPTKGTVNPENVDVTLSMTDIASLGITGTKTHSLNDLSFNVGTGTVDFGTWVGSVLEEIAYSATVKGDVEGHEFSYALSGAASNDVYTLTGKPTNVQTAYQQAVRHVTTSANDVADSYATIAEGSYLAVNGEILEITKDLTIDNLADKHNIYETILDAAVLGTESVRDDEVVIYLAEGTTLAIDSSKAVLDDSATITLNNVSVASLFPTETTKYLTYLRDHVDSTSALITFGVTSLGTVLDATNGKTMEVSVDFEEEVAPKGKFNFELVSGTAKIIADVAEDYTINVSVNKGAIVDPSEVTATVYMKGVTGLGLGADEERSHSVTVKDILNIGNQNLDDHIEALEDFTDAKLSGSVTTITTTTTTNITKDAQGNQVGKEVKTTTSTEEAPYTYNFVANNTKTHYGVTGTQTGAQAAWAEFVSHLTAGTQGEDSKATIAAGSYLVVDGQTLVVEKDLTLDNLDDRAGNYEAILEASTLVKEDKGTEDADVEIYLLAGTELSVGSSVVTLDDNARVVFDGVDMRALLGLDANNPVTVLEWARENIESTKALVQVVVLLFNPLVVQIDEVNDLTLDVIFEVEEEVENITVEDPKEEEPKPVDPKPEDPKEEDPKEETPKEEEPKDDEVSTQTGDNAPVVAYASITLVAALALVVLALRKRFGYSK